MQFFKNLQIDSRITFTEKLEEKEFQQNCLLPSCNGYLCSRMNYLSVEQVSKRYGERLLFADVNFGIQQGQKTALVAANGTGKSTLLRILSGTEAPDSGIVTWRKDIRVAFLEQDPLLPEERPILEAIFDSDIPVMNAVRHYEHLLNICAEGDAFEKAAAEMDRLNAWDYESQAKQVLGALGIEDLEQIIKTLSGGQKRRVALAQVLLSQPDFMILDEPTNHLDLDMIEWLEQYLIKSSMTLLMVTHDRYYLESICDEIIELVDETMYRYKGNFSYYLEKKATREEQESASVERARNTFRKELEWVRNSPKARTTKSKSRLDRFESVKTAATGKREERELQAGINMERLGGKICEFHRVRKTYGTRKIIDGFDYVFKRAERVGIVGKNGCGKTTFLELMTGKTQADGGKIVIGDTVVFGYYTQEGIQLKPGMRIIEAVREIAEVVPLKGGQKLTAADLLERFLFPRKRHFEFIEKLSGGEKKRLYLLTILMKNPNFLILDEPTNDLDIFTLSALEEYLEQFNGCLAVVSHDRYFMDKLVEHVLWFKGDGTVRDIPGNYTLYREQMLNEERRDADDRKIAASKIEKPKEDKAKLKLSFKEKFELDQIEKDLPILESRKEELESLIGSGTSDHEQLLKWTQELGKISADLDAKGDRWLQLSEMAGS